MEFSPLHPHCSFPEVPWQDTDKVALFLLQTVIPVFLHPPQDIVTETGLDIDIVCAAQGDPRPTITWAKVWLPNVCTFEHGGSTDLRGWRLIWSLSSPFHSMIAFKTTQEYLHKPCAKLDQGIPDCPWPAHLQGGDFRQQVGREHLLQSARSPALLPPLHRLKSQSGRGEWWARVSQCYSPHLSSTILFCCIPPFLFQSRDWEEQRLGYQVKGYSVCHIITGPGRFWSALLLPGTYGAPIPQRLPVIWAPVLSESSVL